MSAPDLLRRFTSTPHAADVCLMERAIRMESSNVLILERALRATKIYGVPRSRRPEFLWRLVSEADSQLKPPWPEMTAFSHQGLSFVNIGQQSFLAVDLESREGVGFLAEELAKDEMGFDRRFLSMLCALTAPALGLVPFSGGCVARDGRGLLVFDPSRRAKTGRADRTGSVNPRLLADEVVFLEANRDGLRSWRQFWPGAFFEDEIPLVPRVAGTGWPLQHQGGILWNWEETVGDSPSGAVVPVGCVFLEHLQMERSKVIRLDERAVASRLEEVCVVNDSSWLKAEKATICLALSRLPAYHLSCSLDQKDVEALFSEFLNRYDHPEGLS